MLMNTSADHNTPHLATAMMGPLHALEQQLLGQQIAIETWLRKEWQKTPTPLTSSVDLRNAGFKLAPVDTNLFPAGFNNLSPAMHPLCIQAAQAAIELTFPGCDRLLIIPENHSRNQFYFESLATLQSIFQKAGFEARIGSLLPEITQPTTLTLPSGRNLTLEPVIRQNDKLKLADFSPCFVLLNNDLSDGVPSLLHDLHQRISPPVQLGWWNRLKSAHFRHYQAVAEEFAAHIGLDPWLINPLYNNCGAINFLEREGEACLASKIEVLLADIRAKYREYDIHEKPFVMVKADAGTYGMGILTVYDPAEIGQLNRKQRTKMSAMKGNQPITKVIIQEGIYSFETWGPQKAVAEPVVYMLGHHVVGGFYRMHKERGPTENLNAPGMAFEPLAFAQPCNNPHNHQELPNRFYAYGVVARLALVAAARELAEINDLATMNLEPCVGKNNA